MTHTARQHHVVFVIPDLKGNGAERFVITLSDELHRQGHHCHIVCFKHFQELDSAFPLHISVFPMQAYRWIPRRIRGQIVARLLDRFITKQVGHMPDLVLSNLLPADRILCRSRLDNVHLIVHTVLSAEAEEFQQPAAKAKHLNELANVYQHHAAVAVSQGVADDFHQLFPHTAVTTVYNPVDTHFVQQAAQQNNTDSRLPDTPYLIHVGKFKPSKRHDLLLHAYAKSQLNMPLVLLGQGELEAQCHALAETLGIADRVIFAGFQRNPYPFIKQAHAMVLSSDFEGLGLVILEAVALNIPVISTNCPSGPREILPADNLVPMDDAAALAAKMREVHDHPAHFVIPLAAQFTPPCATQGYLQLIHQQPQR